MFSLNMRITRHRHTALLFSSLSGVSAHASKQPPTSEAIEMISGLQARNENTTIPSPVSASVSQYWEGNDGPWSSFAVQVGQKAQDVRVLPSTASTSTWVVLEDGCPFDAPSDCATSRGRTFNPNDSLTWVPNSIFQLGMAENLGYNVFGEFGFDTITLGWQGSGGPSVEHSIVAGIADTASSWLGVLGLNPRPTNFSNFPNNPQVSFLQALKNQNSIPSVSWAYTAGARYRLDKVFGSLILGGYDASRFTKPTSTSEDLTFPFYADIERDLLVGISSITTSNTTSSATKAILLKDGVFASIDSTVPHLWLPESVCRAFESAFGLTWNSSSELYTLNSSQHSKLLDLNPTVTITLTPRLPPTTSDKSVAIALPYAAFDLNVSWPHAETSTYYFPLKRAANDTQYTLGRAFLQEAYLIADYERQNFSVWPCKWDAGTTNAAIVPIHSLDSTSGNEGSPNPTNKAGDSASGLAKGAIAGIAVGTGIGVVALGLVVWFILRRTKLKHQSSFQLQGANAQDPYVLSDYPNEKAADIEELDSNTKHELGAHNNKFGPLEASNCGAKHEMEGSMTANEVDNREAKTTVMYEMDAQEDAGLGPRIVLEPPTAISPGPESGFPAFGRRITGTRE